MAAVSAGVGWSLFRSDGRHAEWWIIGPVLPFEAAYAKAGFDAEGVRGAIYMAALASFCVGPPALMVAAFLGGRSTHNVACMRALTILCLQWCLIAIFVGRCINAAVLLAGAIGSPWILRKLGDGRQLGRWPAGHAVRSAGFVSLWLVATPAAISWFVLSVWTPPTKMVTMMAGAYPSPVAGVAIVSPLD